MGWQTKVMVALIMVTLIWSRWNCFDRLTWWLEAAPVLIALPILLVTSRSFPLTPMLYSLMTIHGLILLVGAKYTYARVPLGYCLQDLFRLNRNCYDRIGHWFQGFVPAILVREILLRRTPLQSGKRMFFLVTCVCLAVSAFYELLEWLGAVILGKMADDFLGTQGDIWDSQWDMLLALIGSIVAQLTLSKLHDNQLSKMKKPKIS